MPLFFDDLEIGTKYVSRGRTITESDIVAFAGISGDFNPLHTDEMWVRENTGFSGRIAHGLLILSVSSGLATPELDELEIHAYLETTRKMAAPTYPGDTVKVIQTVADLRCSSSRPRSGIATFDVAVTNQDGMTVQQGTDIYLVGRGQA
ncbi:MULTISPECIES: MaoC/PaaZ C-terminal domain-containing protein [unclassified Mycolicibacterium]|uniref:MaoC family dehydratase n=1 Tax=unclassified Mycolicibacterium TaxID=2636767 RepID=UPI001F4C2BD9|nr:MaoC/PaaZ C-terminal domain-containing protein [Mycolicibacterium sp. YH-1]UNB50263.1 MaoC family dehydratase N-terminal domain-containing protein [Mycolicibacterium sp. YH-1]